MSFHFVKYLNCWNEKKHLAIPSWHHFPPHPIFPNTLSQKPDGSNSLFASHWHWNRVFSSLHRKPINLKAAGLCFSRGRRLFFCPIFIGWRIKKIQRSLSCHVRWILYVIYRCRLSSVSNTQEISLGVDNAFNISRTVTWKFAFLLCLWEFHYLVNHSELR